MEAQTKLNGCSMVAFLSSGSLADRAEEASFSSLAQAHKGAAMKLRRAAKNAPKCAKFAAFLRLVVGGRTAHSEQ